MSQIKDLIKLVDAAPTIRDAISLSQTRWMHNYQLTTGRKDGEIRFQNEFLTFLDIVQEKGLGGSPKFKLFGAFMKSSNCGLSFKNEGHLYIQSDKDGHIKCTVGNLGKREMLRQMPNIKEVYPGVCVMKGDVWKFDRAKHQVIEHMTTEKSSVKNVMDDIVGCYVQILYKDGKSVFVYMDHDELVQAQKKSPNPNGPTKDWPKEMCKKTVYGRAKKDYYRDPEGVELIIGKDEGDPSEKDFAEADVVDTDTGEVQAPYATTEEVNGPNSNGPKSKAEPEAFV